MLQVSVCATRNNLRRNNAPSHGHTICLHRACTQAPTKHAAPELETEWTLHLFLLSGHVAQARARAHTRLQAQERAQTHRTCKGVATQRGTHTVTWVAHYKRERWRGKPLHELQMAEESDPHPSFCGFRVAPALETVTSKGLRAVVVGKGPVGGERTHAA